jgi:hypothetical protein
MRDRIPAIVAGVYAVLGALSFLPVFTGKGALSGAFVVLLGVPWTPLLSRVLDAVAPSPSSGLVPGLVLGAIGIAINVAILYLAARWIVGHLPSR